MGNRGYGEVGRWLKVYSFSPERDRYSCVALIGINLMSAYSRGC